MNKPIKLSIGVDLLGKNLCEKEDGIYFWEGNDQKSIVKVSEEQNNAIEVEYTKRLIEYKKELCKTAAIQKLSETDWVVLSDVDVGNKQEFLDYRNQIRNLAINPVENPIWPEKPNSVWSNI